MLVIRDISRKPSDNFPTALKKIAGSSINPIWRTNKKKSMSTSLALKIEYEEVKFIGKRKLERLKRRERDVRRENARKIPLEIR